MKYNPDWTQKELEQIVREKTVRVVYHEGKAVQVELDGRWHDANIERSDVYPEFEDEKGELDIMFFRLHNGRIVHTSMCKYRMEE